MHSSRCPDMPARYYQCLKTNKSIIGKNNGGYVRNRLGAKVSVRVGKNTGKSTCSGKKMLIDLNTHECLDTLYNLSSPNILLASITWNFVPEKERKNMLNILNFLLKRVHLKNSIRKDCITWTLNTKYLADMGKMCLNVLGVPLHNLFRVFKGIEQRIYIFRQWTQA